MMKRKKLMINTSESDLAAIAVNRADEIGFQYDRIRDQLGFFKTDKNLADDAGYALDILGTEFEDAVNALRDVLSIMAAWEPGDEA